LEKGGRVKGRKEREIQVEEITVPIEDKPIL